MTRQTLNQDTPVAVFPDRLHVPHEDVRGAVGGEDRAGVDGDAADGLGVLQGAEEDAAVQVPQAEGGVLGAGGPQVAGGARAEDAVVVAS